MANHTGRSSLRLRAGADQFGDTERHHGKRREDVAEHHAQISGEETGEVPASARGRVAFGQAQIAVHGEHEEGGEESIGTRFGGVFEIEREPEQQDRHGGPERSDAALQNTNDADAGEVKSQRGRQARGEFVQAKELLRKARG